MMTPVSGKQGPGMQAFLLLGAQMALTAPLSDEVTQQRFRSTSAHIAA